MERYSKSQNAVEAEVGNSIVILNTSTLKYFEVSGSGTRIWEILQNDSVSEDEIVSILLAEFEVDESQCRSAVQSVLNKAIELGLVSASR